MSNKLNVGVSTCVSTVILWVFKSELFPATSINCNEISWLFSLKFSSCFSINPLSKSFCETVKLSTSSPLSNTLITSFNLIASSRFIFNNGLLSLVKLSITPVWLSTSSINSNSGAIAIVSNIKLSFCAAISFPSLIAIALTIISPFSNNSFKPSVKSLFGIVQYPVSGSNWASVLTVLLFPSVNVKTTLLELFGIPCNSIWTLSCSSLLIKSSTTWTSNGNGSPPFIKSSFASLWFKASSYIVAFTLINPSFKSEISVWLTIQLPVLSS